MRSILITSGVFPPEIGGPASYGRILAESLSPDFKVTVLTYSKKRNIPTDKNKPYRIIRVWQGWPKGLRHLIYALRALSLASAHDLILSLNSVSAGWPALIAARLKKKKFFVKVAGDYAWEMAIQSGQTQFLLNDFQKSAKNGKIALLHRLQTKTARKADGVIVPSEYLAGIVKGWGVSSEKIKVIYNGIAIKPGSISKEDARRKLNISGNILLSVGRLVPWKGFRMLIKIIPKLQDINQFFKLIIVGDGPDRVNLEAMVRNLDLERKVSLVGVKSKEELGLFLAAADIFILNSGYEGFSHQILEAMAYGLPVITSNAGGNPEVIHQGENGFMVKYNDEFNLIEAIRTLWQNQELREQFKEKSRETAAYFSIEKMIEETKKALML